MCIYELLYIYAHLYIYIFPDSSVGKEFACGRPQFDSWVGTIRWRRKRLPPLVFWPGELHGQSMGWQRVRHNWATFTFTSYIFPIYLSLLRWLSGKESTSQGRRCRFSPWAGKIPWRGKWQPTPGFLLEKSHGQKSLVGCSSYHCCKTVRCDLATKQQQAFCMH